MTSGPTGGARSNARAAIFFDKDGTLVEDVPYNVDPARITLTPCTREAVHALKCAGYLIVIVTNQSGVARRLFDESALGAVRERLEELLGVTLDGFYYCPHAPDDACPCRKPMPGMIAQAAQDLQIDLARSWMIGDILNDVEAGRRAGLGTILIDNGNETEWVAGPMRQPHCRVADVGEAVLAVLCGERVAA